MPIVGLNWKDKDREAEQLLAQQGSPYVAVPDDLNGKTGIDYGVTGTPETYIIDKAGVIRMSKAIAIDNAKKGIRCNTVVPGLMNTPLVSERLARQIGGNDAEKLIAERNARVPIGQMGDGWDVAHAVLFLASEEAKHITATEIVVDGGLTATRP